MGPDFLDRQSLWNMFCCNFICHFFSSRISGQPVIWPDIWQTNPDTGYKKGRISVRPDIRCNPKYYFMRVAIYERLWTAYMVSVTLDSPHLNLLYAID